MALEAPLRSSTDSILSSYSPLGDMSVSSPESASLQSQYMARSSTGSDTQSLRPNSFIRSHPAHLMSPSSDIVGPSPVTSNGTEIEDEATEETAEQANLDAAPPPQLYMIKTNIPDHVRKSLQTEEVVSVIHAPQSFQSWTSHDIQQNKQPNSVPSADGTISPPPSEHSSRSPPSRDPPQITTNIRPRFSMDAPTPQAQNLPDVFSDNARIRSSTSSSLGLIPESTETEGEADVEDDLDREEYRTPGTGEDAEVHALKAALEECWTLCNTLANLSSIHRERVFNNSGTPDAHEKAWKSCWKLCKRLYNSRDDVSESLNIRTNLDLCRDFCQALFDVRQRKGDAADSVLRVSFELNNHLYSAQDSRLLPEAFRERTLDFYITLCHRLMKQRSELAEETDSLLRACWTLAEMLFSLRQSKRDGKAADEELLGSAVQACWELCDIFREGWTQVRPDRGTPRPSQVSFFQGGNGIPSETARSSAGSRASLHSKRESLRSLSELDRPPRREPVVPETPVTEFEDTPISPESASPTLPNIMVLGTNPDNRSTQGGRWSSSASTYSGYSQNSAKTSSTATTAVEDINITRIKTLVVKAAMNIGFNRDAAASDGSGGTASLQSFVKSLPTGSFGSLPAHSTLLQNYKNLVLADSAFRTSGALPARGKRTTSIDVAKSVNWMTQHSGQYGFLRELFKLVFGFQLEEADSRKNVSIAV
ncbi:hypothetical protein CONLIGDRAFT_582054 [Coniochaeta ligniaria NRRL 30616]|uniref:DUF7624 domain-containing protein n=1 Tax=Coniochaeta ligniaria NRRL 30616 TaxID=1408157 RepID=A0A1J7IFB7_9PEZI|nr:hypothetical protein CONLIGDRAFT_582054 [Coniochaeta ligniaria NRRL 30616]